MSKTTLHQNHSAIVKRLRRAYGHLNTTIHMIEENKNCVAIAQQLYAVEKAIANAKKALIHDHVDHCLEQNWLEKNPAAMDEFKQITRYL